MGQDQDDMIIAPYTTIQKRLLAITYIHGIFASALTEEDSEEAIEEISAVLRQNHKIPAGEEEDFHVRSQEELSSMLSTTTDLMTVLLACIAGISLLVGGIGIMNIMLVSITERTREIGVRMALGAKRRTIRMQFVIEAIMLCLIGGIIGILIGIGIGALLGKVAGFVIQNMYSQYANYIIMTVHPSVTAIMLSLFFSMLTGVFFGYYPANKASKMEVIDALRYE